MTINQLIDILSIDSKKEKEVIEIKLSMQSKKREVADFLMQLHNILQDENFNIETSFTLICKQKEMERFSTPYTLLDLDYDVSDVIEQLSKLTVEEYSETLVDKDDTNPPLLYVFGKNLNNQQVYIKVKIKTGKAGHVLCVSFHYAEKKMLCPYA